MSTLMSKEWQRQVALGSKRKRIKKIAAIAIAVLAISLISTQLTINRPVSNNEVTVNAVQFTETIIPQGFSFEIWSDNYTFYYLNVSYDSNFRGAFIATSSIILYILTQSEFNSFLSNNQFWYVFSSGLHNHASISLNLLTGSYFVVFSNRLSSNYSFVTLSEPITITYSGE